MADSGTVDLVDEDDDEFEKDMKEAIAASLIMQGRLSASELFDTLLVAPLASGWCGPSTELECCDSFLLEVLAAVYCSKQVQAVHIVSAQRAWAIVGQLSMLYSQPN